MNRAQAAPEAQTCRERFGKGREARVRAACAASAAARIRSMRFSRLASVGAHRAQWVALRPSTPMGWEMGSRQRMQRTTLEPSGRVFMSGFPAGELPRTAFNVRAFNFAAQSRGFPLQGIGPGKS